MKPEFCGTHPGAQIVELQSISVYGGTVRWGCAICNLLRAEKAEAALREVRTLLQSDSVEYDDVRAIEGIIDDTLAGSPSRPEIPQVLLFTEGRCPNMGHKRYAMLGCTECSPSRSKNLSTGPALSDRDVL